MGWSSIIFIIVIGILLMVLDFLVVPGGIVSILGLLCMAGGVIYTFVQYGLTAGFICLLLSMFAAISIFVLILRSKTWRKLQLKTRLDGKMNEFNSTNIHVGLVGRAISRIAPMGTGEFNGEMVEVSSLQGLIEEDTEIEITKIDDNKIYVKQKV